MSHSLGLSSLLRVNGYGTVTHMAPEVLLHSMSSSTCPDVRSSGDEVLGGGHLPLQ